MPRPCRPRRIRCRPRTDCFKPQGIPLNELEEVNLEADELEAIRLIDLEGLYQEEAAKRMNVSRQTIGNILNSAHRKIAESLLHAKALYLKKNVTTR